MCQPCHGSHLCVPHTHDGCVACSEVLRNLTTRSVQAKLVQVALGVPLAAGGYLCSVVMAQ